MSWIKFLKNFILFFFPFILVWGFSFSVYADNFVNLFDAEVDWWSPVYIPGDSGYEKDPFYFDNTDGSFNVTFSVYPYVSESRIYNSFMPTVDSIYLDPGTYSFRFLDYDTSLLNVFLAIGLPSDRVFYWGNDSMSGTFTLSTRQPVFIGIRGISTSRVTVDIGVSLVEGNIIPPGFVSPESAPDPLPPIVIPTPTPYPYPTPVPVVTPEPTAKPPAPSFTPRPTPDLPDIDIGDGSQIPIDVVEYPVTFTDDSGATYTGAYLHQSSSYLSSKIYKNAFSDWNDDYFVDTFDVFSSTGYGFFDLSSVRSDHPDYFYLRFKITAPAASVTSSTYYSVLSSWVDINIPLIGYNNRFYSFGGNNRTYGATISIPRENLHAMNQSKLYIYGTCGANIGFRASSVTSNSSSTSSVSVTISDCYITEAKGFGYFSRSDAFLTSSLQFLTEEIVDLSQAVYDLSVQQSQDHYDTLYGFDSSRGDQAASDASHAIADYDAIEGSLFGDASNTLDSFDPSTLLSFSDGIIQSMSFVSAWISSFIIASGDFFTLYNVAIVMIVLSALIGFWRWWSGRR